MIEHEVVSEEQWIEARRALLAEEKGTDAISSSSIVSCSVPKRRHDRYEDDGRILPATAAKRGEHR